MKTKANGIFLGSALLLATVAGSWAEPSPDLMNSVSAMRLEAAKVVPARPGASPAKTVCAKGVNWSNTRTITAGQSSVAVPDFTRHSKE